MSTKKENIKIYIGTSGWCYDSWSGVFYPESVSGSERLKFYAEHFNTVEINSSFYHLPKPEAFTGWARKTPDNFKFAVKASRYITHIKRLKDCDDAVSRLIDAASSLGEKLSLFLFQLPANLKEDYKKLESFLKILPEKYSYVFEFRDESWFCDEIYKLLDKRGCGIVISSSPEFPYYDVVTGGICYLRMHGSKSLYNSKYTDKELEECVNIVIKYQSHGYISYIYFNNDAHGYAIDNAETLKHMLSK